MRAGYVRFRRTPCHESRRALVVEQHDVVGAAGAVTQQSDKRLMILKTTKRVCSGECEE